MVFSILIIVMVDSLKEQNIIKTILSIPLSSFQYQKYSKNIYAEKNFNGLAQNKLYHRTAFSNKIFKYAILCNLVLLHIYFQLDLLNNPYSFYFNWLNFITSIFGCALLSIKFIFNQQTNEGERLDVYQNLKIFIIQFLLMVLMPYPFTNNLGIISQYKLNYCLLLLCIIRSTAYSSILLVKDMYMSPQANRICKMYDAKPGITFSMRSVFKDSPISFMIVIFIVSLFAFAILFRVAQYQIYEEQTTMDIYFDMFYMTVITMTSVGYGDFKPQSVLGRLIGTICVTWGVLIVSIMVVVLINAFRMDRNQSQALNILKRIQNTTHIRNIAGEFIRQSLWRIWKNYKLKMKRSQKLQERKLMIRFRLQRRLRDISLISQYQIDFYKQMVRHFERAFINIQNLASNNLMIINYLSQRYIFTD